MFGAQPNPTFGTKFATNPSLSKNSGLWRGLVGIWDPAMGPQGSKLFDMTNRHAPATLNGLTATSWTPGSLTFNGTSSYVDLGTVAFPSSPTGGTFTVMAWVKGAAQTLRMIVARKVGSGTAETYLSTGNTTSSRLRFLVADGTLSNAFESTFDAFDGNWHHVVGAHAPGLSEMFIDARFAGSSVTAAHPTGSTILYLGARDDPAGNFFAGQITDVRIWNRKLTRQEIAACYSGASPLTRPEGRFTRFKAGQAAAAPASAAGGLFAPAWLW